LGASAGQIYVGTGESSSLQSKLLGIGSTLLTRICIKDRLREWNSDVMRKLQVFPCLAIKALDIDGIRVDKAIQVTVDALATWSTSVRNCAKACDKQNFLVAGEVVGGNTLGSIY
jgi:alpha-1,3-glucan synthase